ncbi:sugar phosphate isomerase/epimerase family protein [Tsuneonella amylolytica]|uniref:sugar phosphate isomerase/epimerase family protein n=1 Tax=Tsuneonella amylolytica TaxID=2338327 RepID=UPI000EA8738D|nr:sugar phosphate isomerase/epimerase family protein [Tsuneonella amylolytica]
MTDLRLRYGVSQFTTKPWSFDEDVERYAALGVDAIEVVEDKLDADRWEEQMAAIAAAGLAISGVQPSVRTFFDSRMVPEPKGVAARTARLRGSIERLGPYAQGAPFFTNTGAHPGGDMAEAIAVVGDALGELASVAADNGVELAIEPLHPVSLNVESAIWTIDQGLEIVDRANSDRVGRCLDYWNVWQSPDVLAAIARAAGRILSVQASDWRTPRSFADRIVPGDGEIPLAELVAATRAAGYDRPYVLEIFSEDVEDSLYDGDIASVVTRSREGLAAAWNEGARAAFGERGRR